MPQLVHDDAFSADFDYQLKVIELKIPTPEKRGAADKISAFKTFIAQVVGAEPLSVLPGSAVQARRRCAISPGRIGVTVRQIDARDANSCRWHDVSPNLGIDREVLREKNA